jgi:hypothetical protein
MDVMFKFHTSLHITFIIEHVPEEKLEQFHYRTLKHGEAIDFRSALTNTFLTAA